jgi:hypothetical protein
MGRIQTACIAFLVCACNCSCVHTEPQAPAFSESWEYANRKALNDSQKQSEGELIIAGEKGKGRMAVKVDAEGHTKLVVGKDAGISADLDIHGGEPEIMFKYKVDW